MRETRTTPAPLVGSARRPPAAASVPHTLAEGEKGENETRSTVETKMDGGKWKRWSDGEANCQSVELRKRGEKKRLEMSAVMKTGGLDWQVARGGGDTFCN